MSVFQLGALESKKEVRLGLLGFIPYFLLERKRLWVVLESTPVWCFRVSKVRIKAGIEA